MAVETEPHEIDMQDLSLDGHELDALQQIEDLVEFEDIEAASDWLRCDLNDFVNASESPISATGEQKSAPDFVAMMC